MLDILVICLEAPLLSFGAPVVDNHGVIQRYPALSMLTGLMANALGYEHGQWERLQALQRRLWYASRADRPGERVQDFQTVDLGQAHLRDDHAWTTRGRREDRKGGSGSIGTHIRLRDYWTDALHMVALRLEPGDAGEPEVADLEAALRRPARPLFLGRKPCLPSRPLFVKRLEAPGLLEALDTVPLEGRGGERVEEVVQIPHWWEADGPQRDSAGVQVRPVCDERDWRNQVHVGQRWLAHGFRAVERRSREGER